MSDYFSVARPRRQNGHLWVVCALAAVLCVLASLAPQLRPAGAADGFEATVTLDGSPSSAPGEVDAGGTVEATVTLDGPAEAASRTAEITVAGPASIDPGSLRYPAGWTAEFSDIPPGYGDALSAATKGMRFTSPELPGDGLGATSELTAPDMVTSTGGGAAHGWIPIHAGERIFNVIHHSQPGDFELNCSDRTTGALCAGYPKELYISTTDDLYTPFVADTWLDGDAQLWIPATRNVAGTADEAGFYCFDTATDAPCAQRWFPLATITAGTAGINQSRSPVGLAGRIGSRLYLVSMRAGAPSVAQRVSVSCFDTVTRSACGRTDIGTATTPSWEYIAPEMRAPRLLSHQAGTRMYTVIDYGLFELESAIAFANSPSMLVCFDSAAPGGACAGFTPSGVPGTGNGQGVLRGTSAPFAHPAEPDGVCLFVTRATSQLTATTDGFIFLPVLAARSPMCFTPTGATRAAPAGLSAAVAAVPTRVGAANSPTQQPIGVTNVIAQVGTKLYIPFASAVEGSALTNLNSWLLCFNTATDAPCTGFGTSGVASFAAVQGGRMALYSTSSDAAGCLWGIGGTHDGWLFSIDPDNGSTPCRRSSTTLPISSSSHYCDPGTTITWGAATVSGVDPSAVASTSVTVRTADGTIVPGFDNLTAAGATVDLSALPPGPDYVFSTTVAMHAAASLNAPATVEVSFDGPPAEICFTLDVVAGCPDPGAVTVDVAATASSGQSSAAAGSVTVTESPACTTTTTSTTTTTAPPPTTSTTTTTAPPPTVPPSTTSTTTTAPPPATVPPSTTMTPVPPTSPSSTPPAADDPGGAVGGAGDGRGVQTPAPAAATNAEAARHPHTGASTFRALTAAALLIAAGAVLLLARRRR